MLLVALGSAGDVNPFLGIGIALKSRGHHVTILTNEHFESAVKREGLDFAPIGTEAQYAEALAHPDFWHPTKGPAVLFRFAMRSMPATYERVFELHRPGETVLAAPLQALGAPIVAEKLSLPLVTVFPSPLLMRSAYSPPISPLVPIPRWVGRWGARLMYKLIDRKLARLLDEPVNAFRDAIGLGPVRGVYNAWCDRSARIIGLWPEWLYAPQPDWPDRAVLTGFIEYDGHATVSGRGNPPGEAFDIQRVHDRPIVFTCGSAMTQGADFYSAAVDACRILDRSGLLLTQHRGQLPPALPRNVRHVDYAPLGELLPKASALVHHGGVGTCARGLRAGVPQLLVPLGFDQFDNLARLRRLGVAEGMLRKRLSGRGLAEALAGLIESQAVRARCDRCAERLAQSDATQRTCDEIEQVAGMSDRV